LHIEPDWILIYRVEGPELSLARTGTHSDVFNE
jgi:mRNA interferase YafQ